MATAIPLGNIPKAGGALSLAIVVLTIACGFSSNLLRTLVLMPGNTILGSMYVWTVGTFAFIEPSPLKLLFSIALITRVGWTAEQPQADLSLKNAKRILLTVALAVLSAGLVVASTGLATYMSSGNENALYKPYYGSGPITIAISICAHQMAGESGAPLSNSLPWLQVSFVPIVILVIEAICQFVFRASRGFLATCVAGVVSWVYLRFFHVYGPGSIGDGRPCFELLSFLPAPLQLPLRPFVNILSPMVLGLPIFAATTGDGMSALPGPVGGSVVGARGGMVASSSVGSAASSAATGLGSAGAAGTVTDAVLERRRELALAHLDRRLAELRSNMGTGAAGRSAGGSRAGASAGAGAAPTLSMAAAIQAAPASASTPTNVNASTNVSEEAPVKPSSQQQEGTPVPGPDAAQTPVAVAAAGSSGGAEEPVKA